eukprot:2791716-Prymnesium_polylepis.1
MREAAPTNSLPTRLAPETSGGTQPITTKARRRLGYATQGRMRVFSAWQQALSAAECTQMRTSD